LAGIRDVKVAGSTVTIDALADQLSDAAPDVVLIDLTGEAYGPTLDSVIAIGLVPDVSVAILADATSPGALAEAWHAGISALLPRDISPDQLVAALKAAANGLFVLHPAHLNDAVPTISAHEHVPDDFVEALTRREREVLQMLSGGLGNKEIAARLGISEHTVKFHVASILGKLGAASRTQAVSLGIRRGLVLL
jgi:DNA-binding NarL/FixJ family response regulator